jgi:hypothetical protein
VTQKRFRSPRQALQRQVPAASEPRASRLLPKLAGGALIALILGTVGWWLGPHRQDTEELAARDSAGRLLVAVSDWKRNATLRGCPTISQLLVDRQLQRDAQTQDPWGQRFRILCTEVGVQVLSAGADRQFQTGDDIRLAEDERS